MAKLPLDAADLRILAALQAHGPLSKTKLADLVHLSPTPCWERVRRLKSAGYVRGFHADIALDRLGDVTRVVVTVALANHRKSDFDRFEARIAAMDEVVDCVATGGGADYVLTVVAPSLSAFQRLMETLLEADLGISRYVTYIVTREIKTARPNLTALFAAAGKTPRAG